METGQKAPETLGVDQNGKELKLSDFAGRTLVLYFYPKDSTPGCTSEACSLRDSYEQFLAKGYAVVGVSPDSQKSHLRFIEKQQLPFPLISDPDHKLAEEMGVWGEKTMCGRKYMGILRTTFIIGPDGTIEKIFTPKQIKVKEHAAQILG